LYSPYLVLLADFMLSCTKYNWDRAMHQKSTVSFFRGCALVGLLIFGVQLSHPAVAQAPTTVLAAESAMNGIVDNLRNSLEQLLTKLDQSVGSGTFLVRMQLSNLLGELNYHASLILNKTFGELDKQQQTFFRNTQQTIADLQGMGDHIAENADRVTERVEFAIASVPFTKTEPRLRLVAPRVIDSSQTSLPVRLTFDGSWLANGKPELAMTGASCKLTDLAEPKAIFECPAAVFAGEVRASVRYAMGKFSAVEEQGFWDRVWTFFGSKPEMKDYPVSIGVVLSKLGHVKVAVTAIVESDESNRRSAHYDTGARHCAWGSDTTVSITPAGPEWTIDVNSIALVLESGERSELRNVTPSGFQVYAVGHNSGNCVKVMGQTVSYDARGWANGERFPKCRPAKYSAGISLGGTRRLCLCLMGCRATSYLWHSSMANLASTTPRLRMNSFRWSAMMPTAV
jgi:hypothetical protein